jgi:hypothetical protein
MNADFITDDVPLNEFSQFDIENFRINIAAAVKREFINYSGLFYM